MYMYLTIIRLRSYIHLYQQWTCIIIWRLVMSYLIMSINHLRNFYENMRWCVCHDPTVIFWSLQRIDVKRSRVLSDCDLTHYWGQGNSSLGCCHKIRNRFWLSWEETGLSLHCSFFSLSSRSPSRNRLTRVLPIWSHANVFYYTCLFILICKLVMILKFSKWTNKER